MVNLFKAFGRLEVASKGREHPDNRGRTLTDTSAGGKELVYVRVEDLHGLITDYKRIDALLRGEGQYTGFLPDMETLSVAPKPDAVRRELAPFEPSRSYPYLSIAKHYGVDYGDVLLFAEFMSTDESPFTPRNREVVLRMNEYGQNEEPRLIPDIFKAIDEFKRIQLDGW